MKLAAALFGSVVVVASFANGARSSQAPQTSGAHAIAFLPDGRATVPKRYREWVYLTSGVDMDYHGGMKMSDHAIDNVFVDPVAFRAFEATGRWPEGTVFAREDRLGVSKGSIDKGGIFQTNEMQGFELHIKDSRRFKTGWAFFASDGVAPAQYIPTGASCYSCHSSHGAVDTTFVQFYPTLIAVARAHHTFREAEAATRR